MKTAAQNQKHGRSKIQHTENNGNVPAVKPGCEKGDKEPDSLEGEGAAILRLQLLEPFLLRWRAAE